MVDTDSLRQWRVTEESFSPRDCSVVEGHTQVGERRLLRFALKMPNLGPGALIIGDPVRALDVLFEFSQCHQHLHFKQTWEYRLWTPSGYASWAALKEKHPDKLSSDLLATHGRIASQIVALNHFREFCVYDIEPAAVPGSITPGPREFDGCNNQGISVGWATINVPLLDGQWIDVTDVPAGEYVLEAEINPERLLPETNFDNDAGAIAISLPDRAGRSG